MQASVAGQAWKGNRTMNPFENLIGHRAVDPAARIGLGAGLVAMGVLAYLAGRFSLQGQTWLDGSPLLAVLARLSAVPLAALGVMIVVPATAARGARYAAMLVLVWIALVSLPTALLQWASVAAWLGPCELFVIAMGLGVLSLTVNGHGALWRRWQKPVRLALAACFILFGLSHFAYLDFTAGMIPDFLPFHRVLAAGTGALHIMIGLGLALGRTARLAIGVGALMMSSFVLLVHVPATISSHGDPDQLTMLAKAVLLTCAAWILAHRWDRAGGAAA